MFVKDGFVIGGEPEAPVSIDDVKALEDRMLILTFHTGEQRLFDANELQGPVFEPLNNYEIFMHPAIDHGVVTWAGGSIDCAPEFMYEHSYTYDVM